MVYGIDDTKASSVSHTPVTTAVQNTDVIIKAESSDRNTTSGRIFFRQIEEQEYISLPMTRSGLELEGRIPGKYIQFPGLEYYIILYLDNGTMITSPEREPALFPYFIFVTLPEQGWFDVLYPERDSAIDDKVPHISASFSTDVTISKDKIQVIFDGKNVTDKCEITQDFLLYVPSKELSPGVHTVTLTKLDDPEMIGSWQFSIVGTQDIWQILSGGTFLSWQWAVSDSDSPYIIYSPGSNYGVSAQLAGRLFGQSFDSWINRSTFYMSRSTDFGFGLYGDKANINAGDIFPSTSKLTLDSMPVRGAEINIELFKKMTFYLIGAENRIFEDSDDQFITGLLNSKFGGIKADLKPLGKKLEIRTVYIHARNKTELQPDTDFSIEKYNDIFSLMTKVNTIANFDLYGEIAISHHLTRYNQLFASELYKDKSISIGLEKQIGTLALELFYLSLGDKFLSEVNPFIESGRNGFGISSRYFHKKGISLQGDYERYYRGTGVNSEIRANVNLSLSKLPSVYAIYYMQRVPYARYDIKGISIGLSYDYWRVKFSANGSSYITNLWDDNTKHNSRSISSNVGIEALKDTNIEIEYSYFKNYKSGDAPRIQWQTGIGFIRQVHKKHLLSLELKSISLNDKGMDLWESSSGSDKSSIKSFNDYFQKILQLKYGYSF